MAKVSPFDRVSGATTSERVTLQRLDETIPLELHEQIRLLKIDVEGAECSALQGAEGILRNAKNLIVLVEITPDRLQDLGGSAAAIFEFMERMGYSPHHIPNDYTAESYFDRRSSLELTPVTAIPESPCDLLFARAETLRTTELPILA